MTTNTSVPNVYFGNLPLTANDNFMIQNFSGTDLKIVKIKFNPFHGKQTKSAFVTYQTREMAEEAVQRFNFAEINNTSIRVNLAPPETRQLIHEDKAKIVILNIDSRIDERSLFEAFSVYGDIIKSNVRPVKGKTEGYAIIQFANEQSTNQAVIDMSGATINGNKVTVEHYYKSKLYVNLYFKILPQNLTDNHQLAEWFQQMTNIKPLKSNILKLPDEPDSKTGLLKLETPELADEAFKKLNGKIVQGVTIEIEKKSNKDCPILIKANRAKWNNYRDQISIGRNLYIQNIPNNTTQSEVEKIFSQYGRLEGRAHIRDGIKGRVAYVIYEDKESASNAIRNSVFLVANGKQVLVSLYIPKGNQIKLGLTQPTANVSNKTTFLKKFPPGNSFIPRAKSLSDYQIQALLDDPGLYKEWISGKTIEYCDIRKDQNSDDDSFEEEEYF